MKKLFGTDGIRGVANEGLDIHLAMKIGQAVGVVIGKEKGRAPVVAIGKDTRLSGDMLESAMVAGLCASGADVMVLGVVPTPAVAYVTIRAEADAGVMISASHNPFQDNGFKIFNGKGFKLSDELEQEVEALILGDTPMPLMTGDNIGKVLRKNKSWVEKYVNHLAGTAKPEVEGLKVFIDCSNGAAARTASDLFDQLKLDLEIIKAHPNGTNINDNYGSTDTTFLSRAVVSGGYDIGIAFDGDADRCIIIDEQGRIVDGDKILGACGHAMHKQGKLKHGTIVTTVMSNLGFHKFAKENGLTLLCANVGDRHVLEKMQQGGYNLGGEQSGHVIFSDDATTGDGQLASIQFLNVLAASGKTVSELVADMQDYPQVLINVPIAGGNTAKEAVMASPKLRIALAEEEATLTGRGRILVRPSGTEPLIRVMVEADEQELADSTAEKLAKLIENF